MAFNIKVPASIGKLGLKMKKHAPTIMVVVGTGLVIGGTIKACKSTPKAIDILNDCAAKLDEIEKFIEESNDKEYTQKDAKKDRAVIYREAGIGLVKTYGVATLAITAGLGLLIGSHGLMLRRNAALTAGYSTLLASFQEYRNRVREAIGEDEEVRVFSGAKTGDGVVYNDDGEAESTVEHAAIFDDGSTHSVYSRLFSVENLLDSCKGNWSKSPTENLKWLRAQQCWANDVLRSRGYLFLNEVYRQLGFKETSDGCIVGWVYDPSRDTAIVGPATDNTPLIDGIDSRGLKGDNLVDFGIYSGYKDNPAKQDFINGLEPCVWLDFNVDGIIYDLI